MADLGGRPEHTGEQYRIWLDEMRPFLELGCSLNRAIEKSGLIRHRTTLYEKYRLKDWFSDKIDVFRSIPGELANEIFVRMISSIYDKVRRDEILKHEDIDVLKHFTKYHRSCQPFFVTRNETMEVRKEDLGKILDIQKTDYLEFSQPEVQNGNN